VTQNAPVRLVDSGRTVLVIARKIIGCLICVGLLSLLTACPDEGCGGGDGTGCGPGAAPIIVQ
jgi:hypothetical protein